MTENWIYRLQFKSLLQDRLSALDHRDRRGRKLNVGQAGGPVRIRTPGFGRRRRGWRRRRYARRQIPVLDLGRWDSCLSARLHRSLVLAGCGVAALVRAERCRASGGRDCNRHVAVAEAGETEAGFQCRALIREGRRTALEVDTGRVNKGRCDGPDKQSQEYGFNFCVHGVQFWWLVG